MLLQMMVCVFALKSQRDSATEHFNIPNNTGETGHLFEEPTSNETACQPRVMHIFPLVFPSNENRQALSEVLASRRRNTFDQDWKEREEGRRNQTDKTQG